MVTGWEEFTHELTELEKQEIAQVVYKKWLNIEYEVPCTMKQMLEEMNKVAIRKQWKNKRGGQLKVTGPRMRKIIHSLRVSGAMPHLIANSKYYFKSTDPVKIKKFIKSCYERANSFREVAEAMKYHNMEYSTSERKHQIQ